MASTNNDVITAAGTVMHLLKRRKRQKYIHEMGQPFSTADNSGVSSIPIG